MLIRGRGTAGQLTALSSLWEDRAEKHAVFQLSNRPGNLRTLGSWLYKFYLMSILTWLLSLLYSRN